MTEKHDNSQPALELSIPGVEPDTIILNGERYVRLNPQLTPEDVQAVEKAQRRYERMSTVSRLTGHDGLSAALLGDSELTQFYIGWRT